MNLDEINEQYIGKDAETSILELQKKGYNIRKKSILGEKDNDILKDEKIVVIRKQGNDLEIISSFFKIEI